MNNTFPELPVRSFLVICLFAPIGVALLVRAWLPIWRAIRRQSPSQASALRHSLDSDKEREQAMLIPCTNTDTGRACTYLGSEHFFLFESCFDTGWESRRTDLMLLTHEVE